MDIIQAVTLAILQGLTEFLPISSSAHLILVPVVSGWEDQGLAFDVAVHVGTLAAVIAFYRKDLNVILTDGVAFLAGKELTENAKLVGYVGLGTIPVGLVGIIMPDTAKLALRSPLVIAAATVVFALLLWFAEKRASEQRTTVTWLDALVVGVFQAIALIPGTSRSGITITGGLLTGLRREYAARFSFLLSIPVIALAGLLKAFELWQGSAEVMWGFMIVGAVISGVIAYLTIGWFLKLLDKVGMMPFVFYRLILGIVLVTVFFGQF